MHLKKSSVSLRGMKRGEKTNYLPHEIVECDDRTGDIQRGVEDVCEVICKGISLQRMRVARPLLVGCGRLVHLIYVRMCSLVEKNPRHLFRGSSSDCPMVVHPEGEQPKHGHVEIDMPPGVGTLNTVLVFELAEACIPWKGEPDQKFKGRVQ